MTVATPGALTDRLVHRFIAQHPADAARWFQEHDSDDARSILADTPPAAAGPMLRLLGPDVSARLIEGLPARVVYGLLSEADPALTSGVLRRLHDVDVPAFLASVTAVRRRELELFMSYPENSAGSLMDPSSPVFRADARVGDVVDVLRQSRRTADHVIMIVDEGGRLLGTVDALALFVAEPDARIHSLAWHATPAVRAFDHRDDVAAAVDARRLTAMPVIDVNDHPVGLLSHRALASVVENEVAADMQSMVGASREERALSSVQFAVRKRLPWLQINLATAFLAAAVVGLFEGTIARFTALAVLLPVVAGQSGNTGAQALAVTMRGLTLREITLRQWLRVVVKEGSVGLINGVAVAVVTVAGVYLWSGSPGLCLVIGVAMAVSMTVAGIAGAGVPLVLRALGQDPAQSSSIVLTTVTDVTGFFSFLGLAAALSRLL
jgi:magnesium transporter